MLKMMKFNELNNKLQNIVKIVSVILFLSPLLVTCVKKTIPYIKFVISGPELVENVDELKKSMFVLTGVVAAELPNVDDYNYHLYHNGKKYMCRIKLTESGNKYVFLPSEDVGERAFIVNYNSDHEHYYYIDFNGAYNQLYRN